VERYATVIHEDPEGGFWAEVRALLGCVSEGETLDETVANIREAAEGWLEVPLADLGIAAGASYEVHDGLTDARYVWNGARNYVRLDPAVMPAHVFVLQRS